MHRIILTFLILTISLLISFNIVGQNLNSNVQTKLEQLNDSEKISYLGDLCWNLREKSRDSSIIYGQYALYLADSAENYRELARINNYLGVVYMHYFHNTESAIPFFHHALENGLRIKDTIQIAYAYNNLGDAFYLIENVPLALEYGESSLKYFNSIHDPRGIAYSYINLGLAKRLEKKYDVALKYFKDAIEIREKLDDKIGIASATLEIAQTYFENQEYDQALNYYQESLILHEAIDNQMYMALSLDGIGKVFYQKGDYTKALARFDKSLQINKNKGFKSGILNNSLGKALVYSQTKQKEKGEQELGVALDIAKQLGLTKYILEVYKTCAEFFVNIKDFKSATKSYDKYLFVYDSLFSVQQFETLSEMQNRFLITQKLNEINHVLEIKKKETRYLIIGILLFLILGAALFWKNIANVRLNQKLKSINESKDKLFSIISHDLKSPFSSILGFSGLLIKDAKNKDFDKIEKYGNFIHQLSNDSVNLITNLSSWSLSQRGVLQIKPEHFFLIELLNDINSIISVMAESKEINILVSVNPEMQIFADKEIIRTVIYNLLSNAIKFTPVNGNIEILAELDKTSVKISVKDSGVGINDEDIVKLFSIKDNYTTPGTNHEKGTGLGLIICKEFIELHKGRIQVDSIFGKGSTFTIILPQN